MEGKFKYYGGASGTVTIPNGATVKQIVVHASSGGATVSVFGGDSIPVPSGNGFGLIMNHDSCVSGQNAGGGNTIVFTGTDMYYVATLGSGY